MLKRSLFAVLLGCGIGCSDAGDQSSGERDDGGSSEHDAGKKPGPDGERDAAPAADSGDDRDAAQDGAIESDYERRPGEL